MKDRIKFVFQLCDRPLASDICLRQAIACGSDICQWQAMGLAAFICLRQVIFACRQVLFCFRKVLFLPSGEVVAPEALPERPKLSGSGQIYCFGLKFDRRSKYHFGRRSKYHAGNLHITFSRKAENITLTVSQNITLAEGQNITSSGRSPAAPGRNAGPPPSGKRPKAPHPF